MRDVTTIFGDASLSTLGLVHLLCHDARSVDSESFLGFHKNETLYDSSNLIYRNNAYGFPEMLLRSS